MADAGTVLVGRIVDAHGLKGEVKIASYTGSPEEIAGYGPLMVAGGTQTLEISAVRALKGPTVAARLRGVSDRSAAERLKGTDLYIARNRLPDTASEEYYHSDLAGLAALGEDGCHLGAVAGVQNFGAGDLLEIALEGGSQTALVPFETRFVPVVDLAGQRVIIADEALVFFPAGDASRK